MINDFISYKYIRFEQIKPKKRRKTKIFECRNISQEDLLGTVKWYSQWRQYCFFFKECDLSTKTIILNSRCLENIADFIKRVNAQHKSERADE